MKIKHMRRDNWKEIIDKDYFIHHSVIHDGKASLIHIKEVINPVSFTYLNGEPFVMCDVGYDWVQVAYVNQPYWFVAFFDPDHRLIQIYIDIIDHTDFSDPLDPTMIDLYLDVVIEFNTYHILDENELEDAYYNHEITSEQYEHAKNACKQLTDYLDHHMNEFIEMIQNEYLSLLDEIKS